MLDSRGRGRACPEYFRASLARIGLVEGARVVIYARGGGHGHLCRALALASMLPGFEVSVLHGAQDDAITAATLARSSGVAAQALPNEAPPGALTALVAEAVQGASLLIADTFPEGIHGELAGLDVRRALVARHLDRERRPDYMARAAACDLCWLPYPEDACEWGGDGPDGEHVGYLVRQLVVNGEGGPLVIGARSRIPLHMRRALAQTPCLDGPFEALPAASTYVLLGGGYNLTYELLLAGARFGILPEPRRFDDPFHRAVLLDRAICSPADLHDLLRRDSDHLGDAAPSTYGAPGHV